MTLPRLPRFMRRITQQSGQTLVEVLVAIGLSGILMPALGTAVIAAREGRAQEPERMQATALLRETDEAVRSVREKGWTNIATNGTYRPAIVGSAWSLTAGAETIGNFTRQVVISDAQRNSSGAIVSSGGTVDPSTKKIVTTVSWTQPVASSVSNETYYQRWLGNTARVDTSQATFAAGTAVNTSVTNTSGGEVQLTTIAGSTSWTTPTVAGSYNASGTTDATDVYVDAVTDRAYITDSTFLYIVNVANPAAPTLLGTYSAGVTLNSVYVSGNFAYLASASGTAELIVVNVTTPASPTLAANVDLTGTTVANSVFVTGGYAYVGKVLSTTTGQNEFFIVEVTTPTAPVVRGSLNLTSAVNSVFVSGNFAYLATSITTAELTIANVTTKTAPTQAGIYNPAGSATATDVYAIGTTVYLAKNNDASNPEFFIINAATPSTPSLIGSYEAGGAVNGVSVNSTTGLAFLATAVTNRQFLVLSLATPATPTLAGSTNLSVTTADIFYDGANAFLASTSDTAELTIMQGTVTAGGYQTSGTFESATIDVTTAAAFNYLNFTISEPASTNIQFQIAANNDNTTWVYTGPDGTASTYYTSPTAIRLGTSGRYIRYKATFTGPGTSTPVLNDIAINYSP